MVGPFDWILHMLNRLGVVATSAILFVFSYGLISLGFALVEAYV